MPEQSDTLLDNFQHNVEGCLAVPENTSIIERLHNDINTAGILVPSEVQSASLCSNNPALDCTSLGGNQDPEIDVKSLGFSDKNHLTNLFSLLLKIDKRNNPQLYKNNYEINSLGS